VKYPYDDLRSLRPNWDSYGAPRIDERAIQKAHELWRLLGESYQVIPTSDGGVQLEEHRGGFDITVCVDVHPT
jgi:hypothetical protein